MKLQKYVSIALLLLLFMFEGMNDTILNSFFPIQAKYQHGISNSEIAYVMGIFDLGSIVGFCFWITFSEFASSYKKGLTLFSGFLTGISVMCFGTLGKISDKTLFLLFSLFLRFFSGIMSSCMWGPGWAFISSLGDDKTQSNKLTTVTLTVMFIGYFGAPFFGTTLFVNFGYGCPFFVIGICESAISVTLTGYLCLIKVNGHENDVNNQCIKPLHIFNSILQPDIFIHAYVLFQSSLLMGFFEATIALYLSTFSMSVLTIGYIISGSGAIVIFISIISIQLNGKHYKVTNLAGQFIFFISMVIFSLSFALHSTGDVEFAILGLFLHAIGRGFHNGSGTLVLKHIFHCIFDDKFKDWATTISLTLGSVVFFVGRLFGLSVMGGFLIGIIGFNHTIYFLILVAFLGGLGSFIVFYRITNNCIFKKNVE